MTATAAGLARLRRRGFWLEYASMAWMTAEAAVAITAGILASSVALTGFGLDSVIEFFAAAIVIWQLRGEIAGQERETKAVRLIGVTFFALAAYLAIEGTRDLITGSQPRESVPGLAITAAALLIMPGLAVAKRLTGRALGNRTMVADSAETAFCAATSAATLLGVGLNAWAGSRRSGRSRWHRHQNRVYPYPQRNTLAPGLAPTHTPREPNQASDP